MLHNIIYILQSYYNVLLTGLLYTLLFALICVFFGTILGMILALFQLSGSKILNGFAVCYIEIFRDTPSLVQIYFFWVFLPRIFIGMTDTQAVLIAIIAGMSAYIAEIIRAGIAAVDPGQTEAADSLGMSSANTMCYIVIPQAIKNILPALCNEFVSAIKGTSLLSIFFLGELTTAYKTIQATTYLTLEPLIIISIMYFILNFCLSKFAKTLERRLRKNER